MLKSHVTQTFENRLIYNERQYNVSAQKDIYQNLFQSLTCLDISNLHNLPIIFCLIFFVTFNSIALLTSHTLHNFYLYVLFFSLHARSYCIEFFYDFYLLFHKFV